jgi:hypothetical protein
MTSFIGRFVGGELVETLHDEAPFGNWVLLSNWMGWESRPTVNHRPRLVNGAVVWHDVRAEPGAVDDKWVEIRKQRDAILRQSDWRPVYAADRGGQAAADWATSPWRDYRQALREITNQADPFAIVWPVAP